MLYIYTDGTSTSEGKFKWILVICNFSHVPRWRSYIGKDNFKARTLKLQIQPEEVPSVFSFWHFSRVEAEFSWKQWVELQLMGKIINYHVTQDPPSINHKNVEFVPRRFFWAGEEKNATISTIIIKRVLRQNANEAPGAIPVQLKDGQVRSALYKSLADGHSESRILLNNL